MDFTYTFLAAVICLLVPVETRGTRSLQSLFRQQDPRCASNLLQIHFNAGGKTLAKCDGTSTMSLTTKFTVEDTRGKKCIQYTDKRGGNTRYYALKVFDRTRVTFMNERCSSTTADAFLFDEEKNNTYRYYKHTFNNNALYLGVSKNCTDDRLHLFRTNRRCAFRWTR